MRTANVLKATRQIADEAMYRSQFGSGPGVLPAQSFTIWATKGGSDTSGDGTDEKPYLTIGKAMTVAKTLPLSNPQPALLYIGPGTYTEDVLWSPFVNATGIDSSSDSVSIDGNVTLDVTAWQALPGGALPIVALSALEILQNLTVDFSGVASFAAFELGPKVIIGGNTNMIGDSVNGGLLESQSSSYFFGSVTVTGATLRSVATLFQGNVLVKSTAAQVAVWDSFSDFVGDPLGSSPSISLDASAGQNVSAFLNGSAAGFSSGLTLTAGGGGQTSYTATIGGIPNTVVLIGGAAPPVAVPAGYVPSAPGNWAGAPPTSIEEALNRIAAKTPGA